MARFEVIESKSWVRDDGRTASIYGAVPWVTPSEEKRWKIASRGYTVRDNDRGTVGIGRQPWATRAEAQAWVDKETARLEDARRWHEANYPKKTPAARGKRGHATKKSPAQLDREIAEVIGRFPYDEPELQAKWRVDPSELRVGMRFDYFGKPYEITKIGRDKAKTIQIARRYKDPFGKEDLIDHRSFPMRALYQQHLRPLRD